MTAPQRTPGAISAAGGFRVAGLGCGIKTEALDMALLVADQPASAAAVFTTSCMAAPPVELCRRHLEATPQARALIVTSGIANAGTGAAGLETAIGTAQAVAKRLDCAAREVLVCSTGVIGPQIPLDKIVAALPAAVQGLAATPEAGHDAATAIMTTDTVTKETLARDQGYVVGGMAKGAGMVRPHMATMLAFVTTDAMVEPRALTEHLRAAVDVSFNAINIDGCQSTNDTVIVLASGASGVEPDSAAFAGVLTTVCKDLARQIVEDAECATRVVTLRVEGAPDDTAARNIGKFVADSDLVKSSFYGADPNWGRILQALGVCGVPIDPAEVTIRYAGVDTCLAGVLASHDVRALVRELEKGDFTVDLVVGTGPGSAEVLTCDLTPEYVSFNGERS